ncbi:MAG: hypothetical protein QOJ20_5072 [Mycobacterium sp.]|nr:hypothetical protein [Mycobacterium sp.]MDT5283877.1 hypothetical protein [Mycobacterium sp.]
MLERVALWSVPWGLGVPAETPVGPAEIADYAGRTWIVNSRGTADEDAVPRAWSASNTPLSRFRA